MRPSGRFFCLYVVHVLLVSLLLTLAAIAQTPVPKFLYVVNYVDGTISVFRIEPLTGQLTEAAGSPFPGVLAMQGVALTPDNHFLYAAGAGLVGYSVNKQTGSLTQIGSYPLPSNAGRIAITPNGKFIYVMMDGLFGYSIESKTGALTAVPGSPFYPQTAFGGGAATPDSHLFYASAFCNCANVYAFSIDSDGSLFTIPGSPYEDDNGPMDVAVEPTGRFVYVVNYGGGVSGFAIASGLGTLTPLPGSPYSTGGNAPNAIAATTDGSSIVVDNQAQNTTALLAIQDDGSLTLAGTPQPAGANPGDVTVDPTSQFVYTSSTSANNVSAYRLERERLALDVVPGAQWETGNDPYGLIVLAAPNPPYCQLNEIEPSVTICTPTNVSRSPVRILAGTTSSTPVTSMQVLVDGVSAFGNGGTEAMDIFVRVPAGRHAVTVHAKNSAGKEFSAVREFNVRGSEPTACGNTGIYPAVAICDPLAGSETGRSVHVVARSFGFTVVTSTAVYVDGKEVYLVSGDSVNTYLNVPPGSHHITVKSNDPNGLTWNSTVHIISR